MPVISVIIPTYNRAALLREAINSVLRQTFRDLEILVVDDGSTDDTPAAAQEYAGRIVYLRQDNRGVNAARNAAIELARGEYIALLDSDDLYLPYALELMIGLLEQFPTAGFAYTDFMILRDERPPSGSGLRLWHGAGHRWDAVFDKRYRFADFGLSVPEGLAARDFDVYSGDVYGVSLRGPQVLPSASLIRRSRMDDLRFSEHDSPCGDWEFFARLSQRHRAIYADVPATLNRSHEDEVRLTRVAPSIQLEKQVEMIDRLWRRDPDFMARHGAAVDARQSDLLMALARERIFARDVLRARETLARVSAMRGSRRNLHQFALYVGAYIPGGAWLLRSVRMARHRVSRVLQSQKR